MVIQCDKCGRDQGVQPGILHVTCRTCLKGKPVILSAEDENVVGFMKEFTLLSRKYNIIVKSCSCCGVWLEGKEPTAKHYPGFNSSGHPGSVSVFWEDRDEQYIEGEEW